MYFGEDEVAAAGPLRAIRVGLVPIAEELAAPAQRWPLAAGHFAQPRGELPGLGFEFRLKTWAAPYC